MSEMVQCRDVCVGDRLRYEYSRKLFRVLSCAPAKSIYWNMRVMYEHSLHVTTHNVAGSQQFIRVPKRPEERAQLQLEAAREIAEAMAC